MLFSPGTLVSFTKITDPRNITEILLKVALNSYITKLEMYIYNFFLLKLNPDRMVVQLLVQSAPITTSMSLNPTQTRCSRYNIM